MPRPTAGDSPASAPISPYHTPPGGMPMPVGQPVPLSYAGQPVPPAPAAKAAPTPAGLFNAFKRRWVLGTFVGLLVAASVAVAVWLVLPAGKHEARGLINLRSRDEGIAFKTNEDYESYRRNQIFILRTRDLIRRTVDDPAVASLSMIRNVPLEERERFLEESLVVSLASPSILAVTVKGNNIEEMRVIVDSHMKRYVDDATGLDRRTRDEQGKSLERLEQSLKDDIDALERRIKLLARSGSTGGESTEKRLAELERHIADCTSEISQLEKEIARDESARTIAKKQLESGRPQLDPDILKVAVNSDPRIIPLLAARDKAAESLADAIKKATDPETSEVVKECRDALAQAEQKLEAKKKQISADIEVVEIGRALVKLKEKIADLDSRIATNNDLRGKFKEKLDILQKSRAGNAEGNVEVLGLQQTLLPQREMLVKLQTQLVELRMRKELDNRASIRELAQAFPNDNLAKKLLLAGGAAFASFFVVVLLVSFLEWRTRRVDGVDQVVTELGMRIIGTVPSFPNRASLKAATETGGANWRFALNEAINSTRTMLLHTARAQSMQVVMVTSATQGEGKTSLASQLASSMATAGMRTLIVDCDLRNPSIHKLFELNVGPGVSEILTQDIDVSDAVQPTTVPNLWVIPAGTCSNRVIAALAQGHPLETLFNRLRGQFDFVIVDSCPVLPVADALLIGQHVDGVVFSIMQDISQLPKVLVASEKLSQLNIPLLGAVVNGIKQDVYSYGYNYVKQLPA